MGSWNRRNQLSNYEDQEQFKDLLVFGYPSTIFPNDYQSEHIAEERHMVPCLGDAENRVDRYDCRLLLPSIDVALRRDGEAQEQCPTEAMEEDMCEEERYLDMYKDIQKEQEEEDKRAKRSAIGFDYGTRPVKEPESDSEDEPFEAPEGIKFPVGLELPPNMKLHHIIEKTASFIVASGTQMEIVIKAKQRNNAEQFGFLEFDNRLNPFYKYLQKLIREKKYIPDLNKRPKKLTKTAPSSSAKPVISSSLAAIAAAHGSDSDDSDSDCELHPSLLSGSVKRPASPEKPGTIGPRKKPIEQTKPPEFNLKPSGDISQRNDVYAALFKNLAHVTRQAAGVEEVKQGIVEDKQEVKEDDDFRSERLEDPDYREWFEAFYGMPCPWTGPRPIIPPTPDLEPILNSYAETVAQQGAEIEKTLASRQDLKLHFMDPKSPYYSYYHHKVRMHQWNMYHSHEQKSYHSPHVLASPVPLMSELLPPPPSTVSSPGPSSLMSLNLLTPEPPMNRRQRRRLLETSRLDESITEPPGVFDPITMFPKSASTPANLQSLDNSKPISFSIEGPREESSFRFDPDADDMDACSSVNSTLNYSDISGLFPPPPTPPTLANSTQMQVDRKEKARIFMEKLLQEKKAKKQIEDEERMKLEEETRRKAEKISESLSDRKAERRRTLEKPKEEIAPKSLDDMINSRINSLLSESGFHPIEEVKHEVKEEEEEKDRKKSRKRSRSRYRSRSRSPRIRERSRSRDRRKSRKSDRHHRSRSRSHSRDRHRRNRSRSRDRSYRR